MRFENIFRNFLAKIISLLFPVKKVTANELFDLWNDGKIKKILFVRQNQGIGDMLLLTPVFRILKEAKRDLQIDLIASSHNYVAIKTNPYLNKIYVWKKSNILNNLSIIFKTRKANYDMAIVVWSHTPSFTSFLYARLSSAGVIISYDSSTYYGGNNWSRLFSSYELKVMNENVYEIDKFLNLISPFKLKTSYKTDFFVPNNIIKETKKNYEQLGFPEIGVFLGGNSKRPDRIWGAKNWAFLYTKLENSGFKTVAIIPHPNVRSGGGNKEENFYDEVCNIVGKKIDYFSDSDILKVAGFIKNLKVFITPDGGIFHLSVALGINTVGIFIKTDHKRWAVPLSWVYPIQSKDYTPSGVSVDDVFKKVVEILR
jgi:ADP-heptose:LPS heptosyltransferase